MYTQIDPAKLPEIVQAFLPTRLNTDRIPADALKPLLGFINASDEKLYIVESYSRMWLIKDGNPMLAWPPEVIQAFADQQRGVISFPASGEFPRKDAYDVFGVKDPIKAAKQHAMEDTEIQHRAAKGPDADCNQAAEGGIPSATWRDLAQLFWRTLRVDDKHLHDAFHVFAEKLTHEVCCDLCSALEKNKYEHELSQFFKARADKPAAPRRNSKTEELLRQAEDKWIKEFSNNAKLVTMSAASTNAPLRGKAHLVAVLDEMQLPPEDKRQILAEEKPEESSLINCKTNPVPKDVIDRITPNGRIDLNAPVPAPLHLRGNEGTAADGCDGVDGCCAPSALKEIFGKRPTGTKLPAWFLQLPQELLLKEDSGAALADIEFALNDFIGASMTWMFKHMQQPDAPDQVLTLLRWLSARMSFLRQHEYLLHPYPKVEPVGKTIPEVPADDATLQAGTLALTVDYKRRIHCCMDGDTPRQTLVHLMCNPLLDAQLTANHLEVSLPYQLKADLIIMRKTAEDLWKNNFVSFDPDKDEFLFGIKIRDWSADGKVIFYRK